ncbi:UNVERIFIED_CONTAM: hypothetical protein NCL1_10257 [Trichonephila clavipes]
MNSLILSGFVALLMIISVHSQDANRCGVLGKRCREGQYCYRPNENYQNVEFCRTYRRKGKADSIWSISHKSVPGSIIG